MGSVFQAPVGRSTSAGEMAGVVADTDWAATRLGPRETWSPSLRLAVGVILAAAFPMALRWGPDFVLIYNDAYRPILGDKHPWALGRPAREAWSEVWAQIEPAHIAILRGEAPSIFAEDMLLRIQRRGTAWDDARFTLGYSPIEDPTSPSGIGGVLVTAVEITERVSAEAELARSEAEFRTFAQAMPNHVWASPPDGQLNWFNQQVYDYSGLAPGELDGTGWTAMVHPDDRAAAGERWTMALTSGQTYETEFRLRRADGVYRWHIARALPIHDETGRIQRWIGTNTDIEEEKAASRMLADLNATLEKRVAEQAAERDRIWQTSQDLLVVVGPDRVFRAANPAWASVIGWSASEVVGKHHLHFIHPDDRPASDDALDEALQSSLPAFENRLLHKDGSVRWIAWTAAAENGVVYASGRNVTVEKDAAVELAGAQEALRQSQKMDAVGQLTGGIAHDFNNMLAVVIGSLELLGRRLSGGDARAQRYIDAAVDAARRAALLTQRLLAFSRQQPLQPVALDANALVAGMSDLLRHSIGADVRLETVLAGGLWRTHADPNQLENIVLNLAVNARDAMPEGGRLTIETQNTHLDDRYTRAHVGVAAGQYVLIAVTDTGSGMPAEVIEKAFEPFFTTKPLGKGTGLGLSQVYGFVKQSGGHVKIYSEIAQGTTIKIYLPRLQGGLADTLSEDAGAPLARGDGCEVVLVVEDEPAVRRFSVDALGELGYRVLEADGAVAAIRLLESHPEIVLMFTDVVMPDINGARLAAEVRRRWPDLKILFTTGYTRNAVVHNGVLDPGVEMIGKPFTLDALAAKLRLVLEGPQGAASPSIAQGSTSSSLRPEAGTSLDAP